MRAVWCIARRELGSYFRSPIAYVVLAAFVLVTGWLFFSNFFVARVARMDGFFAGLPFIFLFFAPALAMRLLAEERGSGTIEILLTLPVRDREVVLGKYLAAFIVLALALAATLPFPITVAKLGNMEIGPVIGGYIGALLLGGLYLAAALFASAVSHNQVVAFIAGFVVCFAIFALQRFVEPTGGSGHIVQYASPAFHYDHLWRGYVEVRSLVYFLSGIAIFVVLGVQALETRKWR